MRIARAWHVSGARHSMPATTGLMSSSRHAETAVARQLWSILAMTVT
jgi:hypothetical protein